MSARATLEGGLFLTFLAPSLRQSSSAQGSTRRLSSLATSSTPLKSSRGNAGSNGGNGKQSQRSLSGLAQGQRVREETAGEPYVPVASTSGTSCTIRSPKAVLISVPQPSASILLLPTLPFLPIRHIPPTIASPPSSVVVLPTFRRSSNPPLSRKPSTTFSFTSATCTKRCRTPPLSSSSSDFNTAPPAATPPPPPLPRR